MPKSTPFSNEIIALTFNGVSITGFATAVTGQPLYISLHTSSPGVGGFQTTNETTYTNYERIAIPRSVTGWTVNGSGVATNVALAQFAQCGTTGASLSHVAIGVSGGTAEGKVLYAGALNSTLAVASGIQPQFAATALTVTET